MLRGRENILKWYDMQVEAGYIIWKICHARNRNSPIYSSIEENGEEDDTTTSPSAKKLKANSENAKKLLTETIDMLEPSDYYLTVNNRGQWGKGQREVLITIPGNAASVGNTGVQRNAGAGYYSEEQVEKRIKEAQETWETKQLLKRIQEQFDEYKKSSGNRGLDKVIEALSPHSKEIIHGLFGTEPGTTAVAVHGFEKGKATTADEQTRLESALETFNDARPDDFLELMELIAKTAKEKPEIVEMLKKMA